MKKFVPLFIFLVLSFFTNAQAVQKEINLEEMIKNEEKEREFKEEEEMKERIAKEQDKQVILI